MIKVRLDRIMRDMLARMPTKDDQNRIVQGMGAAAMAYWKRQAQQNLRSTSREYIQGLSSEAGDRKFTITLSGTLPNLVEKGFKGGDMRTWMLSGPSAKQGKNGKYLVIPFQHGTPGTTGRNVGTPMPADIHAAARKLAPTISRPKDARGRSTKYGQRLTANNPRLSEHAKKLLTTKAKPWHAGSIHEGMIREQKKYAKATQTSGYNTFRTISENVIRGKTDKAGRALEHWYHPGIRASHFAQKTQKQVLRIARDMIKHGVT